MKARRILFVISCINSKSGGAGGHYRSLLETAAALAANNEVQVAVIGDRFPQALMHTEIDVVDLVLGPGKIWKTYLELSDLTKHWRPDIIHSFDTNAHLWVRMISRKFGIPCCVTKCGGPNPAYTPHCDSLVLFSAENHSHYSTKRKFRRSSLRVISNRVSSFGMDWERIEKLKAIVNPTGDRIVFLRISRIGNYYRKSSVQLLNLVNDLRSQGLNCVAVFVGAAEDGETLSQLREIGGGSAYFLSQREFTVDAKRIIGVADVVLGTGRSFMEACSAEKIVLCPSAEGKYPILVDEYNFEELFSYNFSERSKTEAPAQDTIAALTRLFTCLADRRKAECANKGFFSYHFDSAQIPEKYEYVYAAAKVASLRVADTICNLLFVLRAYYR